MQFTENRERNSRGSSHLVVATSHLDKDSLETNMDCSVGIFRRITYRLVQYIQWAIGHGYAVRSIHLPAALFAFAAVTAFSGQSHAQSSAPLLTKGDLVYEGAFQVPDVGGSRDDTFKYGGTAIGFNPINNSLFLTGHKNDMLTAEISIPNIINSENKNDLDTATILQDFYDTTEGQIAEIDPTENNGFRIGGHLVHGGRLIVTGFAYYDANGSQGKSHFARPLSLATSGEVIGAVRVGDNAHYTSGYMAPIPPEWQAPLGGPALTGNCCRSIISKHSWGPAVSVFDPDDISQGEGSVEATDLLLYTSENPLGPGETTQNPYFNRTTRVEGVVFPNGTRSVLFFGQHGIGPFCYGDGIECNDPVDDSKGNHAYPYVYQVWAYDANELVQVKNGLKQPHELVPYEVWNFNIPFERDNQHDTAGAAYDPATDRIFFSQPKVDDSRLPLIHVFRVNRGPRPNAPQSLTTQ